MAQLTRLILTAAFGAVFGAAVTGDIAAAETVQVGGQWSQMAPLPQERTEVSVTTDGEIIYLLGGFVATGAGSAAAPLEVFGYDPATDDWSHITDLPQGVNHTGLVYLDDHLYVVGGYREATFEAIESLWIYDLENDTWQEGPPLPTPRGALAVAVHDGKIHAIGGVDDAGDNTGAHEVFDPVSATWQTQEPLPTPRDHHRAATIGGEIVVLAGRDDEDDTMTANEIYDPESGTWRDGAPVPTGRSGVAIAVLDGHVYLFGGEAFRPLRTFDEAERYDPTTDTWETLPPMPTPRHGLGAAPVGGHIYVISGGPEAGFAFSDVNERLTPDP